MKIDGPFTNYMDITNPSTLRGKGYSKGRFIFPFDTNKSLSLEGRG